MMEQKRQLCMIKLNLFDQDIGADKVEHDHQAIVSALEVMTPVCKKYIAGDIDESEIWPERNRLLAKLGIKAISTRRVGKKPAANQTGHHETPQAEPVKRNLRAAKLGDAPPTTPTKTMKKDVAESDPVERPPALDTLGVLFAGLPR